MSQQIYIRLRSAYIRKSHMSLQADNPHPIRTGRHSRVILLPGPMDDGGGGYDAWARFLEAELHPSAARVAGHKPHVDDGYSATRFTGSAAAALGSDRGACGPPTPRTPLCSPTRYESQSNREWETDVTQQTVGRWTTPKEKGEKKKAA